MRPADFHDRPHCDLEKTWHGLHFLFTGTAWEGSEPACYLVHGGEAIADADELGYSVLQALGPARTRAFSAFLASLTRQELERRFDAGRMMALEIYPETWTRASSPDSLELGRLLDSFDALQIFVGDTARAGDGLVGTSVRASLRRFAPRFPGVHTLFAADFRPYNEPWATRAFAATVSTAKEEFDEAKKRPGVFDLAYPGGASSGAAIRKGARPTQLRKQDQANPSSCRPAT